MGCGWGWEWAWKQAYNAGQVKTSVNRSSPQQKTGCSAAVHPAPLAVALLYCPKLRLPLEF